jgi:hypothetical protein
MAGRINLADEHALRDWPARFGVDPFTLEAREVTGRDEGIVLRPGPTLPDRGGR